MRLFLKDSANHSIVALGFLLLAAPALAQSVGEKTGVNSALGISPTTADFVKEIAMSDMFEVESNTLAQDKGNALEKKFAAQMVTDHTKTSTELKGLVSSGKVKAELPVALDGSHQGKLESSGRRVARISARLSIRCRSARTGTRCRCSSAIQSAATMPT